MESQQAAKVAEGMMEHQRLAHRQQALQALERAQPLAVGTQLVLVVFGMVMATLIALASRFRPFHDPQTYLAVVIVYMAGIIATPVMRMQRQVNALADLVTQLLEKP